MTQRMSGKKSTTAPKLALLCASGACLAGIAASLSGCTSSKTFISVGPVTFTDANGNAAPAALTSITAGAATYVDATLTNDKALLGVDWTVTCGSAPAPGTPLPPGVTVDASCGTFTPVHTASAPVPSYASSGAGIVTLYTAPAVPPKQGVVTLYAAATGDHSRYSTVTLPVVGAPISIQFGSVPPASVPVNGAASFKAVLTNDYVSGGANWSAICGAKLCGSFSPAKTASGVSTIYTAPSAVPPGGTVIVSATSVTDPTKSIGTTISIEPIGVNVAAASPTVTTGDTDLITATVTNDVTNAGVDWTLGCAGAGACGTITPHTASGVAATYTAPATAPASGGAVTIQATSSADKTTSGNTVVTVTASLAPDVRGRVMAGLQPVVGSSVRLYAGGIKGYGSESTLLNASGESEFTTDEQGGFKVAGIESCPGPSSQVYLVSRGGNAGGGENPNLTLLSALGPCSGLSSLGTVTVNEVTTVASAYSLAAFMRDAVHVGAPAKNTAGLASAVARVNDLVDRTTGQARATTLNGRGVAPQAEIDTLANLLNACAETAGGAKDDGSLCGNLFKAAGGASTTDTLQAIQYIVRHSADSALSEPIYEMARDRGQYLPVLSAAPRNWTLALLFSLQPSTGVPAILRDSNGDVWLNDRPGVSVRLSPTVTDFAGPATELTSSIEPQPVTGVPTAFADRSGNQWLVDAERHLVAESIGVAAPEIASDRGGTGSDRRESEER
jgi:hypothetical protein